MNLKQLSTIYSKLNGLLPSNSSLVITRDSVLLRSHKSWFGQKTLLWYEHKCNGRESGPSTRGSIGWGWFPATSSTPPLPPTHTHLPHPPPLCTHLLDVNTQCIYGSCCEYFGSGLVRASSAWLSTVFRNVFHFRSGPNLSSTAAIPFVFTSAFFCFPAYFISFSSRFFFCLVWLCVWPLRSRAIVRPLDAFVFTSAFFCFPDMFSFFSERIFLVSHQSLYLIFPLTCYCFGRPPFFVSLPPQTMAANQAPGPAFVVLIFSMFFQVRLWICIRRDIVLRHSRWRFVES